MATRLQIRQGTNTENNNFTGASGELTFDTTNKEIRIHDGTTQGGITIANKQLLDTKLDKNISLNYSHITNCITEIPQDIKLEIVDGVLTLKAGSNVYTPNGSGVFDKKTVTEDVVIYTGTHTGKYMVFDNGSLSGNTLRLCGTPYQFSGTTAPSSPQEDTTWYDTTNNIIKVYQNSQWTGQRTLPLAIVTFNNGVCVNIDQIFNGFGYIGSTVFVLPGVKGLVPNGRNEDGTLKNTARTTTNVSVYTVSSPANYEYQLAYNGGIAPFYSHMTYNAEENINYNTSGTTSAWGIIGSITFNNNQISELNPKTVFHAVDYNDSNYISQQGMPSSKYVNIPADKFGTTGTAHTAPGNGYFVIRTVANNADCTLAFQSAQEPYYGNSLFIPQGNDGRLFVPVKKGDQVKLYYTNLGTGTGDQATVFNFIYSQGQ